MIGQQIYTRERRGLFRPSEGYDTVAKSANLTEQFVKDFLHPYCVYSPSRKLQSENAEPDAYPFAFTVIRFSDGRTLVGRTVYVAADFTGQRSTFFTHNYVLPADYEFKPEMIRRIFFMDGYDISNGSELPELSKLPEQNGQLSQRKSFAELGVTYPQFACLVDFIFKSASGAKKIYLQVPVEPANTTDYATCLLEALFSCLPDFLTQNIGYLTYSREPENKKGLNIIFLESDSVRQGDPRVQRDFFMDLSKHETAPRQDSPFIKFLWKNAGESTGTPSDWLDAFYKFASAFKQEFTVTHWDYLITIYKILYRCKLHNEENIIHAVAQSFYMSRQTLPGYSFAALSRSVETALFTEYINLLLDNNAARDILSYAGNCMTIAAVPTALFAEVFFWLGCVPRVFELPEFLEIICSMAGEFLDSADDPIKMANVLYIHIKELCSRGQKKLALQMADTIDKHLMLWLDFENLTRTQLTALPPAFINMGKGGNDPTVYLTLEILKKASYSLDADVKIDLRRLIGSYKLPEENEKYLIRKLKEFFAGYVREEHFGNLSALMDGAELLEYVNTYAPDGETRAKFLLWAGGENIQDAVKEFIKSNIKDGAFKERIYKNKRLKEIAREIRFGKLAGILK